MQFCDTRDLLRAATAHSRLQQAAVMALSNISAGRWRKDQGESLLLYLAKHGQHVRSLALHGLYPAMQLLELPPSLTKLSSLQLEHMTLQLQPGLAGTQGVLRAGLPLTRLELSECGLLDGAQGLEAALAQLPDLQHLSIDSVRDEHDKGRYLFPTAVLSQLTNPTSLFLGVYGRDSSSDVRVALRSLRALTRLVGLELDLASYSPCCLDTDMLSGAVQLTRLQAYRGFEPQVLAGKTQLQHLTLMECDESRAGAAQLLSGLQHLTQLTYLDLSSYCRWRADTGGPILPPAAYAGLTASSRLQHLDFRDNTLPSAAWQYMCPPGRTLLRLQHLNICDVKEADGAPTLLNTSTLVSCCPGLQTLKSSMPCSSAQLAPLQRLIGLHTLAMGAGEADEFEGVQGLCQLTGLQELEVPRAADARILQLTQLQGLTALSFTYGPYVHEELRCDSQVSWG
jgi:hypothetical protein